jgi:hypothetical protein
VRPAPCRFNCGEAQHSRALVRVLRLIGRQPVAAPVRESPARAPLPLSRLAPCCFGLTTGGGSATVTLRQSATAPCVPPALPLPAGAPQRCYASSAPVGGESPVRSQAATDPCSLLPSLPAGALPLGRFGSQPAPVVSFCWHRPGVSAPTRRALREGPGWPFSDLRASWFRRNGPYWEKPAVGAARQVLQPDD